jgi:hypothetical protein
MEKELYSVVVYPNDAGKDAVAKMKDALAAKLGRAYASRNSKAHVTICEFLAHPAELSIIKEYVKQFCKTAGRQDVRFSQIYSFHSTSYIAPDDQTDQYFKSLLKAFKKSFPFHRRLFGVKFSSGAHISIGRLLDLSQIEIAGKLFNDRKADVRFQADGLVIRKFDAEVKQYRDIAGFKFKAEVGAIPQYQLSLF